MTVGVEVAGSDLVQKTRAMYDLRGEKGRLRTWFVGRLRGIAVG